MCVRVCGVGVRGVDVGEGVWVSVHGWVAVYMHVARSSRVQLFVPAHVSCLAHVHVPGP